MTKIIVVSKPDDKSRKLGDKITKLLEKFNLEVTCAIVDENLHQILESELNILVFNVVPLKGDKYSWFLPALCDFLKIPYTGSGIFTISTFQNGYYEKILYFHGMRRNGLNEKERFEISMIGNGRKVIFAIHQLDNFDFPIHNNSMMGKLCSKIQDMTDIIKNALKISDYWRIVVEFTNDWNTMYFSKIIASPSLEENSTFCETMYALGLSYEEILAFILYYALKRHQLPLPESLIRICERILKNLENKSKKSLCDLQS